jgi:hypothetical protein
MLQVLVYFQKAPRTKVLEPILRISHWMLTEQAHFQITLKMGLELVHLQMKTRK